MEGSNEREDGSGEGWDDRNRSVGFGSLDALLLVVGVAVARPSILSAAVVAGEERLIVVGEADAQVRRGPDESDRGKDGKPERDADEERDVEELDPAIGCGGVDEGHDEAWAHGKRTEDSGQRSSPVCWKTAALFSVWTLERD